MKKIVILLVLFLSTHANACISIEQAQNFALLHNRFLILYFSETNTLNASKGKDFFWINTEDKQLFQHYIEYTVFKEDRKSLKKYHITSLPTVVIIDGNGMELYRYNDYKNPTGMKEALQNFVIPKNFLINDLYNFHQHATFESAVRISHLYLDYSLMVDEKFRENVFNISQSYLAEAQRFMKRKSYNVEKSQKLELLKLFYLAYAKQFVLLNNQLAVWNIPALNENNKNEFYFLRYIASKGLRKNDDVSWEQLVLQREGFENYLKKAQAILTQIEISQTN